MNYSIEQIKDLITFASGKDVDFHLHLYPDETIVIPGNGDPGNGDNGDDLPPTQGNARYIRADDTLVWTPDTREHYPGQPPGYNKNGNPILTPYPVGAPGDARWKMDKNDEVVVGDNELASGGIHVRRWKQKSGNDGEILFFINSDLSKTELP